MSRTGNEGGGVYELCSGRFGFLKVSSVKKRKAVPGQLEEYLVYQFCRFRALFSGADTRWIGHSNKGSHPFFFLSRIYHKILPPPPSLSRSIKRPSGSESRQRRALISA